MYAMLMQDLAIPRYAWVFFRLTQQNRRQNRMEPGVLREVILEGMDKDGVFFTR